MLRSFLLVSSAVAALATTAPAAAGPKAMTAQEARHFVSRTGFGASLDEIARYTGLSYETAVDLTLSALTPQTTQPLPSWVNAPLYPAHQVWALGATQGELFVTNRGFEMEGFAAWWFAEMISTPTPLVERLTLFWHDHFATSFEASENSQWMARQNQFFRSNAAGNFEVFARGILRDPAMLTYLSNTENVKSAPNENLAREYFELFTLGQGRGYTQKDVEEAARALTGFGVADFGDPVFAFYEEDHDFGRKSILGQSGRFDGDDLPNLVLSDPQFGPYIVEKLWRHFVSDIPDPAEIDRLTQIWRDAGWELKPLLRELFLSEAFWDPASRGRLVKSPVELIVGTARTLGIEIADARMLTWASEEMGQWLFMPPNVGGWPENTGWISDATALTRAVLLADLLEQDRGRDPNDRASSMAMMGALPKTSHDPTTASGLRIGEVFAFEAHREDRDIGGLFSLFDIALEDQSARHLPFWFGYEQGDDSAHMAFHAKVCGCLTTLPKDDDDSETGWVILPEDEDDLADISSEDRALLIALVGNLPAIMDRTEGQPIWQDYRDEPEAGEVTASLADLKRGLGGLLDAAQAVSPEGFPELHFALSQPDALGLQGLAEIRDLDDLDAYFDTRERHAGPVARPSQVFDSRAAWSRETNTVGLSVSEALLAVSASDLPRRGDVEDHIRAIVLSPHFQVN